jgi:chemotaxis protein CheD
MKLPSFTNLSIVEIGSGEYFVGHTGKVIKTLLGSCVAVCLYDSKTQIVGMNHFLLATDRLKRSHILDSRAGYYGVHAMELVINEMMKLGANRNRIKAKVFGGGNVVPQLANHGGDFGTVGEQNIIFAYEFLKRERISIAAEDVGGDHGRIIYFDSTDYSVYVSLINQQQEIQLEKKEILYYENSKKQLNNLKSRIEVWDD